MYTATIVMAWTPLGSHRKGHAHKSIYCVGSNFIASVLGRFLIRIENAWWCVPGANPEFLFGVGTDTEVKHNSYLIKKISYKSNVFYRVLISP